uniref:Uncharacterized protein n=1 Tax=Arundo donax TaxID=35708 RepID=A0A0A9GGH5_ARUDO
MTQTSEGAKQPTLLVRCKPCWSTW